MAKGFTVTVDVADVRAKLKELGNVARASVIEDGLRKAAAPVIDAAKSKAPSPRIGNEVRLINLAVRDAEVVAQVGIPGGRNPAFHGLFHELGTGPRMRRKVGGKFKGAENTGTGVMPRRPWLRPAFDQSRSAAEGAIADHLRAELAKVAQDG